jgi:hypothetical protein
MHSLDRNAVPLRYCARGYAKRFCQFEPTTALLIKICDKMFHAPFLTATRAIGKRYFLAWLIVFDV